MTPTVPDTDTTADGSIVAENEAVAATESYETAEGVVLYDAERPLAWIQSDGAVRVEELV